MATICDPLNAFMCVSDDSPFFRDKKKPPIKGALFLYCLKSLGFIDQKLAHNQEDTVAANNKKPTSNPSAIVSIGLGIASMQATDKMQPKAVHTTKIALYIYFSFGLMPSVCYYRIR
jgi:hypothetical protein